MDSACLQRAPRGAEYRCGSSHCAAHVELRGAERGGIVGRERFDDFRQRLRIVTGIRAGRRDRVPVPGPPGETAVIDERLLRAHQPCVCRAQPAP